MVQIKRKIVSTDVRNRVTYGNNNAKKTVTVHQTGNTRAGANAEMHARLQSNGNSRAASWHYQVDDKEAIQSFEDDAQCWHAGDGRGNGNLHSIAVEICINSDGEYKKAVENGAALVKHLIDKHNLSTSDIKQHYHWSGKNCPAQIRLGKDGITWDDFIGMVTGNAPAPSTPKPKTIKPTANLKVDGYWGKATTTALQRYFKTPVDGEIWGQYKNDVAKAITGGIKYGKGGSPVIKALQRLIGVKQDGVLGKETISKLQAYLGTPVDGELWSPSTMVKELQRRLNAGTLF